MWFSLLLFCAIGRIQSTFSVQEFKKYFPDYEVDELYYKQPYRVLSQLAENIGIPVSDQWQELSQNAQLVLCVVMQAFSNFDTNRRLVNAVKDDYQYSEFKENCFQKIRFPEEKELLSYLSRENYLLNRPLDFFEIKILQVKSFVQIILPGCETACYTCSELIQIPSIPVIRRAGGSPALIHISDRITDRYDSDINLEQLVAKVRSVCGEIEASTLSKHNLTKSQLSILCVALDEIQRAMKTSRNIDLQSHLLKCLEDRWLNKNISQVSQDLNRIKICEQIFGVKIITVSDKEFEIELGRENILKIKIYKDQRPQVQGSSITQPPSIMNHNLWGNSFVVATESREPVDTEPLALTPTGTSSIITEEPEPPMSTPSVTCSQDREGVRSPLVDYVESYGNRQATESDSSQSTITAS